MASAPSDHEWELNRENIRPLRGGRSVSAINNVFGGARVSIKEAEAKFETDFAEAETSSDPLEICTKYVAWFEEMFPSGKQSHLYPILTRIINKLGYREEYLDDERMLKMWFKLAENRGNSNPEALFERAFTAGCCRHMAKFYIRWAEVREDMHDIDGARTVLRRARDNGAVPLSLLNEASDQFEMRQLRAFTEMEQDSDDEGEGSGQPARIALGGLTGLGRHQKTPAIRFASDVASGVRSGQQQAPFALFNDRSPSASDPNAFMIFEGAEEFDEDSALVPEDFGDDLARVVLTENTKEPAKWKEARINNIKKTSHAPEAAFEVFDEAEYKRQKKEKRQREKATSRLLIRDETLSPEELLAGDIEQVSGETSGQLVVQES